MVTLSFPQWSLNLTVEESTTVAQACALAGHPLDLVCGGTGRCNKCMVDIQDADGKRTVRSCVTPVSEGMSIWTKETEEALHILEHGTSFVPKPLPDCPEALRYAAACDLGTTSVVVYLYDRQLGKLLGRWSTLNKQNTLGADVVARMQAALVPEGAEQLRLKGVETVNSLLQNACQETGLEPTQLSALVVAGNSAMAHLLFAMPVHSLARSPYVCHREDSVVCSAQEMGIHMAPNAMVEHLPLIGSFVGGDTVAALLAADWETSDKLCMLIDLGTNGELVVGNQGRRMAASAAAGPAMEGADVVHGMRGTDGAIEGVSFGAEGIELKVIGGGKPTGLCGSGLVDLLAQMIDHKVATSQGRMTLAEDFLAKGGTPWIGARLCVLEDDQRAFLLADSTESGTGKPIYFYQADLRALQLSKGAIAAAAQLLLTAYGIEGEELDEIQLAGAFGNYIDVESAQKIGLIPDFDGVPVRPVGNAAGVGAQMYLLSEEKRLAAKVLAEDTVHVELAAMEEFTYTFAAGMELCPMSEMDFDD